MHITSVSAANLKGRTFTHILGPKTLIMGANFTGKTAIIEAVRVVLKGFIPEIGKKTSATFELSSASSMTASLHLSDGRDLARKFILDKGATKESTIPKDWDIGGELDTPMLDAASYFQMSERQRIDYVFSKVAMPESMTPAGIVSRLERLSFGDEHHERIEDAKAETIGHVKYNFEKADTVSEALSALTGFVIPDMFTEASARVKQMEGAARTLAELKLRAGDVSAATLTDLRNARDRLNGLIREANKEHGRLTEQASAATRVRNRREEVARLLLAPAPSPENLPAEPVFPGDMEAVEKRLTELQPLLAVPVPLPDDTELKRIRTDYTATQTRLEAVVARLSELDKQVLALNELKACPHCGAKGKAFNKATLSAMLQEMISPLAQQRQELGDALRKLGEDGKTAKQVYETAGAKREAYRLSQLEANKLENDLAQVAQRKEHWKQTCQRVERENASRMDSWKRSIAALRDEDAKLADVPEPTRFELEDADKRITSLRAAYDEADLKLADGLALQRDLLLATQAAEEHELAASKLLVIKAFKATLLEVKGELVATAFEELLKVANEIVGGILPSPLAFNEETSEVGRWTDSGFVGHRTFSGSEQALTYVAISAALSTQGTLRVLPVDELGRLTPDLQWRVLQSLSKAVDAGRIDQFIAVIPGDWSDMSYADAIEELGVRVIETKEAA